MPIDVASLTFYRIAMTPRSVVFHDEGSARDVPGSYASVADIAGAMLSAREGAIR